jgi:LmbE family N-acetylglucosaminyl deacetylase
MEFHHRSATCSIPDGRDEVSAWKRITHLGIGAHADDLEFMALHGILAGYNCDDQWFGGVTCTNGAGSARHDLISDEALIARRHAEQEEAARIGEYGIMTQLGYSSAEAKDAKDQRLTEDLIRVFQQCRPHTVYTHNPADKHETHVAVMARVIRAIRTLPPAQRPQRLLGCEVWRDLDWLDDEDKVALDVSANPELAARLAGVFTSQTGEGKRYDLAVRGRELANATFSNSHETDQARAVWFAMDLTPMIIQETISISQFVNGHLARFKNNVMEKLNRWER